MTLKVRGTEPEIIQLDENGKITDLKELWIYKGGQHLGHWIKPYKLTISKSGNCSVAVGIKSTDGAAIESMVHNGSSIRHGSYLDIAVTADPGYEVSWTLNGTTQSKNNVEHEITGNVSIVVTATVAVVNLERPVISGTFNYDPNGGFYYLSCQIRNTNSRTVAASILVYSNGAVLERSWTKEIASYSVENYYNGEMYSIGAKVEVTFTCAGCGASSDFTTFGNYTSSSGGGSTDESSSSTS